MNQVDCPNDIGSRLIASFRETFNEQVQKALARRIHAKVRDARSDPDRAARRWPFELIQKKIDSGHMGMIGLHEFYRLTGDRNVLETMDAAATMSRSLMRLYVCASILMHVEKDNPDDPTYRMQDRYCGWPLYEIAEAYSRTGHPEFAKEASYIVKTTARRARPSVTS